MDVRLRDVEPKQVKRSTFSRLSCLTLLHLAISALWHKAFELGVEGF